MEEQTNIEYVIIASSVTVVFIGLGFLIFVIIQKIHRHKLEAAKVILETQNNDHIQRIIKENKEIKAENKEIKQDLARLKKEVFGKENDA